MQFLGYSVQWCIHAISFIVAVSVRNPSLLRFRQIALWFLIIWSIVGMGLCYASYKKRAALTRHRRVERSWFGGVLVVLMFVLARSEVGYMIKKHQVLHAEPQQLYELG